MRLDGYLLVLKKCSFVVTYTICYFLCAATWRFVSAPQELRTCTWWTQADSHTPACRLQVKFLQASMCVDLCFIDSGVSDRSHGTPCAMNFFDPTGMRHIISTTERHDVQSCSATPCWCSLPHASQHSHPLPVFNPGVHPGYDAEIGMIRLVQSRDRAAPSNL